MDVREYVCIYTFYTGVYISVKRCINKEQTYPELKDSHTKICEDAPEPLASQFKSQLCLATARVFLV